MVQFCLNKNNGCSQVAPLTNFKILSKAVFQVKATTQQLDSLEKRRKQASTIIPQSQPPHLNKIATVQPLTANPRINTK
jgi:hypothetical protein